MQVRRFLPLLILVLGLVLFFALDLDAYVDLALLRERRADLQHWVAERPVLAVATFIVAYALLVAFSLPVATLATMAGGFLFGPWLGTAWAVTGAVLGATTVFLSMRAAFGASMANLLRRKAGPRLAALEQELRRNNFHYLLFLRLVPAFPFWLVNIAPALLGTPLGTYVSATAIGILPGTFAFAYLGHGLDATLQQPDGGGDALSLEIVIALTLLALLSLLPVWLKRRRGQE